MPALALLLALGASAAHGPEQAAVAAVPEGSPAPAAGTTTSVLVLWERSTPPAVRRDLLADLGPVHPTSRDIDSVEVAVAEAPELARRLSARAGVVVAEVDRPVYLAETVPNDPLFEQQWGLRNPGRLVGLDGQRAQEGLDVGALDAWAVTRGSPEVTVALVDSGIDLTHPDLAGSLWVNPEEVADGRDSDGNGVVDDVHGFDVVAQLGIAEPEALPPEDHGTMVASVLAARADDGIGMAGMAPEIQILPVRAFVEDPFEPGAGQGTLQSVVAGLSYAIEAGADVINVSWETPASSTLLERVVAEAGVPVVAAAGNRGLDLDHDEIVGVYPAGYRLPNLVAVTALDPFGEVPAFATTGAGTIDLAAPGVSIVGALPGGGHADLSSGARQGTSFAVPFVSGALALGRIVAPEASTGVLVDTLLRTTEATASLQGRTTTGGMLDAAAFLANLDRPVCGDVRAESGFDDVAADSVHAAALGCVQALGIVAGYPDGTFRPGGTVTRGEVATTLARVVAAADAVPQDAPSVFTDTAGSTHAPALDALAALGIVEGNEQGEARPAEPVTRGQAAALLVRTHTVLEGEPRTPTRRWFVDTEGSTHADALDVGRDLGLVSGRDRVTADPDAGIRRDQLTSMLARLLDALARAEVELDLAEETPEDS